MPAPPAFVPAVPWVLPFVLMVLALGLAPLAAPRFWHSNARKLAVAAALAAPVVILYARVRPHALVEAAADYTSFTLLLGALFTIAGGVRLTGDLEATPLVNTAFLAAGALLASLVGTTGASMLMVRPLLETNRERRRVVHTVVFFIFLASNVGGCLTPLGDPPLLLGYLAGVPFTWTLRLLPLWATAVAALLAVYFLWDRREHARERPEDLRRDALETRPLQLAGGINLALFGGVVPAVALLAAPWREAALVALAGASLAVTPRGLRAQNRFGWAPLLEVAALFVGVFATMRPALDLLQARGGMLGVREPWQYFWATGLLSSLLDNAPTYMAFLALGQGQHLAAEVVGVPHAVLEAISAGAVLMGANTYIGNGPNFMVRAIAEEQGVAMPGFAGYMAYSGAVLLPLFALLTVLFFR